MHSRVPCDAFLVCCMEQRTGKRRSRAAWCARSSVMKCRAASSEVRSAASVSCNRQAEQRKNRPPMCAIETRSIGLRRVWLCQPKRNGTAHAQRRRARATESTPSGLRPYQCLQSSDGIQKGHITALPLSVRSGTHGTARSVSVLSEERTDRMSAPRRQTISSVCTTDVTDAASAAPRSASHTHGHANA